MSEVARPISIVETRKLFAGLEAAPGLLLAVSGGPDSLALLVLAARWRERMKGKPRIFAATVNHGLRPEAQREAMMVARLARQLSVPHCVLQWTGVKPKNGLQQAARHARYALLAEAAREAGATHIVTAHTRDDQAETVLMRMARGSGIAGLSAMARQSARGGLRLVRPLLDVPKMRLIATLARAKIQFADDPSNRDPHFTRVRIRDLMPALAREGLTAERFAKLACRLRRADDALETVTVCAMAALTRETSAERKIVFDAAGFFLLPSEIGLRLVRHAIDAIGDEGPAELGKLETLFEAATRMKKASKGRFRRSLAGTIVTIEGGRVLIERAPPRRQKPLTKGKTGRARRREAR